MSEENIQTILIDNGSSLIRAGFGGDEAPKAIVPSVIGRPKYKGKLGSDAKDFFVGNEALSKGGLLSLKYPIEHGIVTNWDDMEKIWHHIFYNELHVDPSEHPVLITEASHNPQANRQKMIEILLETFNVPSFYIGNQGILSLYASGRTTGIVLDIGDGVTQIVPGYEDYTYMDRITRLNIGGRDVTERMTKLLFDTGKIFDTTYEKEIARDIKEKCCYVAHDYDAELQKAAKSSEINKKYELSDGMTIELGKERFICPEMVFKPYIGGFEYDGIHKTLFNSIMNCEEVSQKDIFNNIVLSGGSTMFEGYGERLEKEITALVPSTMKVRVVKDPMRKNHVWVGGSILSSLTTFPNMLITKKEYQNNGLIIYYHKYSRNFV